MTRHPAQWIDALREMLDKPGKHKSPAQTIKTKVDDFLRGVTFKGIGVSGTGGTYIIRLKVPSQGPCKVFKVRVLRKQLQQDADYRKQYQYPGMDWAQACVIRGLTDALMNQFSAEHGHLLSKTWCFYEAGNVWYKAAAKMPQCCGVAAARGGVDVEYLVGSLLEILGMMPLVDEAASAMISSTAAAERQHSHDLQRNMKNIRPFARNLLRLGMSVDELTEMLRMELVGLVQES